MLLEVVLQILNMSDDSDFSDLEGKCVSSPIKCYDQVPMNVVYDLKIRGPKKKRLNYTLKKGKPLPYKVLLEGK